MRSASRAVCHASVGSRAEPGRGVPWPARRRPRRRGTAGRGPRGPRARCLDRVPSPVATSSAASAVRARPPTSSAHALRARPAVASTSRTCGYGARCSACRSSPSSQTTARPRSRDRGEHRRPGADDRADGAPPHRQPRAVALRGAGLGGQDGVPPRAAPGRDRRADPGDVTVVGDDDERAPPGRQRRLDRDGRAVRPRRARAARSRPRAGARPAATLAQERRRRRCTGPRSRRLRPAAGRRRERRLAGRLGLDPRVPGRHRQPQDVGQRAGVPVRHLPGQGERPPARAPVRRTPPCPGGRAAARRRPRPTARPDRRGSRRPAARRTAPAPALPGGPPRRAARGRGSRTTGPGARSGDVHRDPGDRQLGGDRGRVGHRSRRARASSCTAPVLPERADPPPDRAPVWGSLGSRRRAAAQAPAAARTASTRSVRSQVKSGSSRPKWPYAAVWA